MAEQRMGKVTGLCTSRNQKSRTRTPPPRNRRTRLMRRVMKSKRKSMEEGEGTCSYYFKLARSLTQVFIIIVITKPKEVYLVLQYSTLKRYEDNCIQLCNWYFTKIRIVQMLPIKPSFSNIWVLSWQMCLRRLGLIWQLEQRKSLFVSDNLCCITDLNIFLYFLFCKVEKTCALLWFDHVFIIQYMGCVTLKGP